MEIGSKGSESLSRKIDAYQDEIDKRNYRNLKKFSLGGLVLSGIIFLVSLVLINHLSFTAEYGGFFCLFIAFSLFVHLVLKKNIKYTLLSYYVFMVPLFGIGIAMGSFFDANSSAITIMVLMCTMFLIIVDKPARLLGYAVCIGLAFLACSFSVKPLEWFMADFVNLLIYSSVGLSVVMLTLGDRVESAQNFVNARHEADYDELSTLLNRGAGESRIARLLRQGGTGAFIIMDVDNFKGINDIYGHQAGDEVIRSVARKIAAAFRDGDIVCRLGGDEFAVFARDLLDEGLCRERLERLLASMGDVHPAPGVGESISLSIGCAICARESHAFDAAYKAADGALYAAKAKGKNTFSIVSA